MSRISTTLRLLSAALLSASLALLSVSAQPVTDRYDSEYDDLVHADADTGYEDPDGDIVILTPQELDELVGPIALYPDDLLAIVLPASTYPLDIVQAARFLDKYGEDSSLSPNKEWDDSVTALLNYPEVVRLMNDDIDWTWELGGAVLNQQEDVIAAVERFRDRAYAAGNLASDDYQTVRRDGDAIEIVPADERVIYVPYYEPRHVVVHQVQPVYYYYPRPRPVYYYPYPAGHAFYDGWFWGVSTAYRIGWSSRYLNVWHYTFRGHPYFGHYYSHHYRRPSLTFYNTRIVNSSGRYAVDRHRHGDRWRPRRDNRARPFRNRPHRAVHRVDQPRRIVTEQRVRQPDRPRHSRGEIRFRERVQTTDADSRRRDTRNAAAQEDLRGQYRRATASTTRDRTATRTVADRNRVRAPVRQSNDRAHGQSSTTRTPARSVEDRNRVRRPVRQSDDRARRGYSSTTTTPARPVADRNRVRAPVRQSNDRAQGQSRSARSPAVATSDRRAQRKPARSGQPADERRQTRPDRRDSREAREESAERATDQRNRSDTGKKPAAGQRRHRR